MALKRQPNYGTPSPAQQGPAIGFNLNLAVEPFAGKTEERNGLPGFDERQAYSPALREMLEFNDYRVALVSGREWDNLQRFVEQRPSPAPAVLLPFNWRELLAKVCEFVRDSNSLAGRRVAQFADVCVDLIKMEVSRMSGEIISLTKQEFKTLKCFLSSPDRVFSRDELLNEAWGYENYPSTRTADNHVLKLRQKLERDPARPVHFRTVHGVGYKFVP